MEKTLISVIIPVYNQAGDIKACIGSLKKQTYKPLEIIVVDDGSDDATPKALKQIKGIKKFRQDHLGPGAARNKGTRKTKGEILVFVDADMTFDAGFVDKLTQPIREGKTLGTFSKEEFVANNDNRWARNWSINRGFKEGRMHPKDYPDEQKVFRAIRKRDFEDVGGFDPQVGYTDDWTLSEKLGIKAKKADGAVFYHKNPDNVKQAFLQSRWMAKRPYKLGIIGRSLALIRVSLPFSLAVGLFKAFRFRVPSFFLFKVVTDFAQFIGILSLYFGGSRAK